MAGGEYSDVFISYRRKDVEFTKQVVQSLRDAGKEVWVDWEDIPPGSVGFTDDIRRGLEGADTFIAILSPDYLDSTYCVDLELGTAAKLNKRIIPLVLKKFDDYPIPESIGHINWIYFTPHAGHENTYAESMPKVLQALDTDLDYVRVHKRLLVKALEWESHTRNASYLLNGTEITNAENWLNAAADKEPRPTQLHRDFISASRARAIQRQRQLLTGVSAALVVTLFLAIIAVFQSIEASNQRDRAVTNENIARTQEAIAVRNADVSRSVALAATAREQNIFDQMRALALALQSVQILNPPAVAQRTLADLAYQPGVTHILNGHEGIVREVEFTSDGKMLVSGAEDNTVIVWDIATSASVRTLTGHTDEVTSIALSPDNTIIASGSRDSTIILWDLASGERLRDLTGHEDRVQSVAFSPDGTLLLSADDNGVLKIWDVATGDMLRDIAGHEDRVLSAVFSPDGTRLAAGGREAVALIFDAESGDILQRLPHAGTIFEVAFNPDGTMVATASDDGTVGVWEVESGAKVLTLVGHTGSVRTVDFSADGRTIISGSDDQTAILWDAAAGQILHRFAGHQAFIRDVIFSADGQQIAIGDTAPRILIWDAVSGNILTTSAQHTDRVNSVALSADGSRRVSASDDSTAIVYADDNTLLTTFTAPAEIIRAIFTPDGQSVISGAADASLTRWNATTGEIEQQYSGHELNITALELSPDGQRLYSAAGVPLSAPEFFAWDTATGEQILTFTGHDNPIASIALNADGSRIASSDITGRILIWDVEGNILQDIAAHDGRSHQVQFHPDGSLFSAGGDNTIKRWNSATGDLMATYNEHAGGVRSISLSADGNLLVSASEDDTLIVWSLAESNAFRAYSGHLGDVNTVAFAPDALSFISGGEDGRMIRWRLDSPEALLTWVTDHRYLVGLDCDTQQEFGLMPSSACTEATAAP